MEADSTTVEQDPDSSEAYDRSRENALIDQISKNDTYFKEHVAHLLLPENNGALIKWLQNDNLIPSHYSCTICDEETSMTLGPAKKVVDKCQWKCSFCQNRVSVREDTIFKNVYCSLQTVIKIILAWCQDTDYIQVASVFGLKKHIVSGIYDKIEKAITARPLSLLSGSGSVLFVELYPDFVDELYPVSSKKDGPLKMQHKILCLADTTSIPTQYWLHVITGTFSIPTENNNNINKKMNITEEILHIIKKYTASEGYFVVGSTKNLKSVGETLKSQSSNSGIYMNDLVSNASDSMMSFLSNSIWKPVIKLCEAAQDLPKSKMQTYLSCALWRWKTEEENKLVSALYLISQYDYKPAHKIQ